MHYLSNSECASPLTNLLEQMLAVDKKGSGEAMAKLFQIALTARINDTMPKLMSHGETPSFKSHCGVNHNHRSFDINSRPFHETSESRDFLRQFCDEHFDS